MTFEPGERRRVCGERTNRRNPSRRSDARRRSWKAWTAALMGGRTDCWDFEKVFVSEEDAPEDTEIWVYHRNIRNSDDEDSQVHVRLAARRASCAAKCADFVPSSTAPFSPLSVQGLCWEISGTQRCTSFCRKNRPQIGLPAHIRSVSGVRTRADASTSGQRLHRRGSFNLQSASSLPPGPLFAVFRL